MSQSQVDLLALLVPGDIIRVSETLRVVHPVDKFGIVDCDSVSTGERWGAQAGDYSTVEMVKRVARRKPQRGDFKNGDKVAADQLREVMWRRGTMICPNHHPELASVLHGDGRWHALNGGAWDFAKAEGKFELLYLPN